MKRRSWLKKRSVHRRMLVCANDNQCLVKKHCIQLLEFFIYLINYEISHRSSVHDKLGQAAALAIKTKKKRKDFAALRATWYKLVMKVLKET